MGTAVLRWPHPEASVIYVSGTWDNWAEKLAMHKKDGIFQLTIDVPAADKQYDYKFIVDGKWLLDESAPTEPDHAGNMNNILRIEDITPKSSSEATGNSTGQDAGPVAGGMAAAGGLGAAGAGAALISSVGPDSSTAQLAGQVPKEEAAAKPSSAFISTVGSDSSTAQLAGQVPKEESKQETQPDSTSHGAGTGAAIAGGMAAAGALGVGAATISSVGPDSSTAQLAGQVPKEENKEEVKPETTGQSAGTGTASAAAISSVGPDSSTAQMAGQVPKEEHHVPGAFPGETPQESGNAFESVPTTVKDSQYDANQPSEATASSEAVGNKSKVEDELKGKVDETKPTSTNSWIGGAAAAVAGTAAAGGAAAMMPTSVQNAGKNVIQGKSPFAERNEPPSDSVPRPVAESYERADASPEAAANPEAVKEKSAMESELKKDVPVENQTGEPAPTSSAALSSAAPTASASALPTGEPEPSAAEFETTTKQEDSHSGAIAGGMAAAGGVGAAGLGAAALTKEHESSKADSSRATEAYTASTTEPKIADENTMAAISAANQTPEPPQSSTTHPSTSTAKDATAVTAGTAGVAAAAASVPIQSSSVTDANAKGTAFEKDPIGSHGSSLPYESAQDPRSGASAFANDPLSGDGSKAVSSAAPLSTATGAGASAAGAAGAATAVTGGPGHSESAHDVGAARIAGTKTDAPNQRPFHDREVSPMTHDHPQGSAAAATASTPEKSKGWQAQQATPSSAAASSPATTESKKKNRRSFFGKIKDKLKDL